MPKIVVLRMGHRLERDKRVTTHVGLVARAFGADGIIISNTKDSAMEESIDKVVKSWGGEFFIRTGEPWRKAVAGWRQEGGLVVHLTMYGMPIDEVLPKIKGRDVMVIVGAEKMPGEVFGVANLNIAVSNQPHSEVAALAIFLDRVFEGSELKKEFKKGRMRIIPSENSKRVEFGGE